MTQHDVSANCANGDHDDCAGMVEFEDEHYGLHDCACSCGHPPLDTGTCRVCDGSRVVTERWDDYDGPNSRTVVCPTCHKHRPHSPNLHLDGTVHCRECGAVVP